MRRTGGYFLPVSMAKIVDPIFSIYEDLTIHATAGSYVEQYAKENYIPYEAEHFGSL